METQTLQKNGKIFNSCDYFHIYNIDDAFFIAQFIFARTRLGRMLNMLLVFGWGQKIGKLCVSTSLLKKQEDAKYSNNPY